LKLLEGATAVQGVSKQAFGHVVSGWRGNASLAVTVTCRLSAISESLDALAAPGRVDTESVVASLTMARMFQQELSPDDSLDHELFALISETPRMSFRECMRQLEAEKGVTELGSELIGRHSKAATACFEAKLEQDRTLNDVTEDEACYLISYTQEWYACKEIAGKDAMECHSPQCLGVRFRACSGDGCGLSYVCYLCNTGPYCSESCFQLHWPEHKWPSKNKSCDCNRSPYR
jgi:hypothetical protein